MIAFWIILTAFLLNMNTSLIGSFLLVRNMSMMSDAISHAVLPGIVIAYLFSGTQDSSLILVGAIFFGLLTTFLIQFLLRYKNIDRGAAIGVIYTFLFAVGIVLISYFTRQVDLDLDCVLYGEIAYSPLDVYLVQNINFGPKSIYILSTTLLLVVGVIFYLYKELVTTSFNEEYAKSIGIPVQLIHYILMSLVSVVTVVSFEMVGVILVVAFIVGPPATAYLWTNSLKSIMKWSILIGGISIVLGYYTAYILNASISGAIAVYIGLIFLLSIIITNKLNLKY